MSGRYHLDIYWDWVINHIYLCSRTRIVANSCELSWSITTSESCQLYIDQVMEKLQQQGGSH